MHHGAAAYASTARTVSVTTPRELDASLDRQFKMRIKKDVVIEE